MTMRRIGRCAVQCIPHRAAEAAALMNFARISHDFRLLKKGEFAKNELHGLSI